MRFRAFGVALLPGGGLALGVTSVSPVFAQGPEVPSAATGVPWRAVTATVTVPPPLGGGVILRVAARRRRTAGPLA